ncbi:ShlB/FhaC/HecB family hemolysin secretion/activation protein [Shewanella yunxiaonensis]|nr:hypothetical protein [Shewanella yunxiaonensis]
MHYHQVLWLLATAAVSISGYATPVAKPAADDNSFVVGHIQVMTNPIFDESADNAIFLHRWANAVHINTRDSVVLERLSFKEGDVITQKQLEEAQRILRKEPYLRDAKILKVPASKSSPNQPVNLLVETWDQWSLLPTVDWGRSGGKNRYSFGIKDDNILGLGMQTQLEYQSDENRTGYKFDFETPLTIIKNARVAASFADNDDGKSTWLKFDKPFYTLMDTRAYGGEYLSVDRINTFRQNGEDLQEYKEGMDFAEFYWGKLLSSDGAVRQRLRFGITRDRHAFAPVPGQPLLPLPQDRDFIYPWTEWEYLQDDYRVMTNVHLINFNEDINLGWHHKLRLGLETNDGDHLGYHLNWRMNRGYADDNELLLLAMNAEGVFATAQPDYYRVSATAEYFYRFNQKWSAYSRVRMTTSRHNFRDLPLTLGDETGMRGYPNEFQYGDQLWLLTTELRNYPNINLYQLAELGWAAFIDVGQAFGGPLSDDNEISHPIGAIGVGARIYSSRSSYGNVVHIDFSLPMSNGENVNGWEWRFEVKSHF